MELVLNFVLELFGVAGGAIVGGTIAYRIERYKKNKEEHLKHAATLRVAQFSLFTRMNSLLLIDQ